MIKRIAYSVCGGIFFGFFPIVFFIAALCTGDEQSVSTFSILALVAFGAGFLCSMILFPKHKEQVES